MSAPPVTATRTNKKATNSTCGVCIHSGRTYHGAPALSREDNKTLICPDCGARQALQSISGNTAEQEQIIETIHRHMESRER